MFADEPIRPIQPLAMSRLTSQRYWRLTLRITGGLLLLWFAVTFLLSFFARDLDLTFFGWPFSFWMAAQGSLLVYGLIIAVYAVVMGRLDDRLTEATGKDPE